MRARAPQPEQQQRALPIGGPGRALDIKQQGEVVFEAMGKEPQFNEAPIGIFDAIIGTLSWLDKTFPGGKVGDVREQVHAVVSTSMRARI